MDKFVTRIPSWKTMHYAPPQKSFHQPRNVGLSKIKTKAPKSGIPSQQPLLEKHQQVTNIARSDKSGRRQSIRDEKLLQILLSQPDQPLVETATTANDEDSGLSSSSSTSATDRFPFGGFGIKRPTASAANASASYAGDENQPLPASILNIKKHLGELSDYVNCEQEQSQLLVSQASSATIDEALYGELQNRPKSPNNQLPSQPPYPNTPKANPQMARLQRDLQSPSAALRVRALKALQSPHKSPYTNFDVPHDEQSIITTEERCIPPSVPSIQELMQNIVVYVEVRTGEDNRSGGVKKVISMLGARVNNKLLRDTTHVIFKDGLLSTYKKAKNWNIPIVSILWIEACKNKRMICDPKEFPISNIDRYENPELYDKMKRQKSMQPDSESNKRIRVKRVDASKDSNTPKTVAETLKKASSLIGDTLQLTSNKKTDISQYFKQLGSIKKPQQKFNTKETGTPTTPANYDMLTESPATQLLNRMNSNCYTPIDSKPNLKSTNKKVSKAAEKILNGDSDVIVTAYDAKRKLNYWSKDKESTKETVTKRRSTRRSTIKENAKNSNEDEPQENEEETPKVKKRGSMQRTIEKSIDPKEIILQEEEEETPKGIITRRRSMQLSNTIGKSKHSKEEDNKTTDNATPQKTADTPTGGGKRRRSSIHVTTSMCVDVSEIVRQSTLCTEFDSIAEENPSINANEKIEDTTTAQNETPKKRIIKRRSTYTNRTINVSEIGTSKEKTIDTPSKPRRTLYTPQRMEETTIIEMNETIEEDSMPETTLTAKESWTKISAQTSEMSINLTTPISSTAVSPKSSSTLTPFPTTTKNSTTSLTPFPITIPSSTLLPEECTPKSTGNAAASLLEEHALATVFNSGRQPGRRRTLFDVSMDIIAQRLQNINDSARRSIIAERPSTSETALRFNAEEPEAILNKSRTTHDLMLNLTYKSQPDNVNQAVQPKENENTIQINEDAVSTTNETKKVEEPTTPHIKKKRKLFIPNDNQWTPPVHIPLLASTSTAKRRRTMMPLTTPSKLKETPSSSPVVKPIGKKIIWNMPHRRKSMAGASSSVNDQQKIKQAIKKLEDDEAKLPAEKRKEDEMREKKEKEKELENKETLKVPKENDNYGKREEIEIVSTVLPPFDPIVAESKIETLNKCENSVINYRTTTEACEDCIPPISVIEPIKVKERVTEVQEVNKAFKLKEKKKLPFLVCTNMHKEQLEVIREVGTQRVSRD